MTFDSWRERARIFLANDVRPCETFWDDAQPPLFPADRQAAAAFQSRVPRRFLELAAAVACHRDAERWSVLYSVLYRLTHGIPHLLEIPCDGEVIWLYSMERGVGRDVHRMQSFVRFRKVVRDGGEHFIAWHRPDHYIVERAAPWFVERFRSRRWSIVTPECSAHWDRRELRFGPGILCSAAPEEDELEDLWRQCDSATFPMPARVAAREALGSQKVSTRDYIPTSATLEVLREAIHGCRGCDLYRCATQPVFGEGPAGTKAMLVGEQPGDNEDLTGRPFVGPAGRLFNRAAAEAGLDRHEVYITGAVRHFKFEERGKRRVHKTASRAEVSACRPWLDAQIEAVRPRVLVALGATAALSLMGRQCAVTRERGRWMPHHSGAELLLTLHPSFILRMPDPERQAAEYAHLVHDLRLVKAKLRELRHEAAGAAC